MLVGPVHQEEVWTRSSQREPARSNIHTSTTALRHCTKSLRSSPLRGSKNREADSQVRG